jgi:hypothetical protein
MRILRRSSRRFVPPLIAVGAIVGLAMAVSSALASPAQPQIDLLTPTEGATVEATGEGLHVTFACPPFVYEEGETIEPEEPEEEGEEPEEGEGGEEEGGKKPAPEPIVIPPTLGTAENYAVHYSTSPAVDSAGLLGTVGFGEAGEGEVESIKPASGGSCVSELELPSKPNPAALYEGRIYWQAYREAPAATDEVEFGPVHSFVVVPEVEEPELIFREQVFAGYLTKIGFGCEVELAGAVIELQEWDGTAWAKVGEAPGNNNCENAFYLKVAKPGRHLYRPVVVGGGLRAPLVLESAKKVVRKPSKTRVTSPAEDGAYVAANAKEREESPVTFTVGGGGTTLKNLKTEAETICRGATKQGNVTIEIAAVLKNAKIAPDGTVFGVTKTTGSEPWTVTLVGSLFGGRFQGELSTSRTNCTGYRTIDAVLASTIKK